MKKILCIVFALLMALSVFLTGCAEKPAVESTKEPDKPVDTSIATVEPATDAETGAPVVDDGLPDVRFDQNGQKREFRVLTSAVSQLDIYTEDHMINQAVHDSVRTRNLNVEERFGVKINVVVEEYQKVTQIVKKLVKSNADDYELCFVHMVNGAALAQNNEVLPFEKLPYVDLSQPWWDKDIKSGFSIRNNIMMVNGDISPTSFNYTSCLYFNKRMFDALDIEYPYKLASEGKWTLDKLIEITKDVSKDMDNDGKITHDSSRDVFGITSYMLSVPYDFYYGAGGMLINKDDEDLPYYKPDIAVETRIYEKIYKALITNNANFETDPAYELNVIKIFTDGRAMFYDAILSSCEFLREMEDDYGILPEPKFDENQKEYKTFVNGASSMVCVPATVKPENREYVSIITEALASEAYKVITPELKEVYLKRKMTRDWESAEMVDIIVRHRIFDMAYVNMYDTLGSYVRDLLRNKSTNVASKLSTYEKQVPKKIDKIIEAFDKSLAD